MQVSVSKMAKTSKKNTVKQKKIDGILIIVGIKGGSCEILVLFIDVNE
jgi:hypothetical protein